MKNRIKKPQIIAICVTLMIVTLGALFSAPARVSAKPMDESVIKVYAYRIPHLATIQKDAPGFLVEIVGEILTHPEYPVEVQVQPAAVLMKYSLIQSVGVAAIALESDFSSVELKDLVSIPLYEKNGKTYALFLNQLNQRTQGLFESTTENLAQLHSNGVYDSLLTKYKLN